MECHLPVDGSHSRFPPPRPIEIAANKQTAFPGRRMDIACCKNPTTTRPKAQHIVGHRSLTPPCPTSPRTQMKRHHCASVSSWHVHRVHVPAGSLPSISRTTRAELSKPSRICTYGTLFIRGFFFEDRVTEAYDKPRRKNSRSLRRKIVTAAMPSPQLHSYLERGWQLESAVMCSWHGNLYILMRSETKTTGQFQYHRALAKPPNQRKKQQNSPPELHAHSAVRVSLSWKACNQVKS
jgi:hypothetical protein